MLAFLSENWATILICLALAAIIFLAIREGCPNSAYCHPAAHKGKQND